MGDTSKSYDFDFVRDTFDPVKAMEDMAAICTAYFKNNPVKKEPGVQYCQSSWDSFLCWPAVRTGDLVSQECPKLLVTVPLLNATRQCLPNGTWDQTNYSECLMDEPPPHHLDPYENLQMSFGVRVIYHVGYSITIVALIIALAIFSYFRSLRCLRNLIHCNLICAFLLSSIAWLVLHTTVSKMFLFHPKLCTFQVIFTNHIHSVPFYWMFVEGMYLFTIIVWAFSATKIKLWYYLVFGWGVPCIPTAIWATVKLHVLNSNCLLTHDITYDYIIHGPVILLLLGNLFFITAIIWVLVTKLRDSNTLVTRQSKKAANATVVLFPLLGVTYIFFIKEPVNTEDVGIVFSYINAVLQSFQGLFVAIIYCFLNGEVQSLLRQKLSALQDSRTLSRYTRSSFFGSPRRSSCYAMATTTCNGRNTLVAGGNTVTSTTAIAASAPNLSTSAGGSKGVAGEEATVLVVCGNGSTSSSHNGERGKKSKILRSCDTEIEASQSMMEDML